MRISDWSSDVCSSDLRERAVVAMEGAAAGAFAAHMRCLAFQQGSARRGEGVGHAEAGAVADGEAAGAAAADLQGGAFQLRSAERRVGKQSVRSFSSRWSPYH